MPVRAALAAACALAGSAGCAGTEAHAIAPAATPTAVAAAPMPARAEPAASGELGLFPGETMAFDVKLAGVTAGQAALSVGAISDANGARTIVVTSRAQTSGAVDLVKHIVDESSTTIDVATGRPLSLATVVEAGGKHAVGSATFTGKRIELELAVDGAPAKRVVMPGGNGTILEMHSAMAELRGWRGAAGDRRTVYLLGGKRLWRIDLTYQGSETIGTPVGNRRAVKFDGASLKARANLTLESSTPGRTFSVWLSDDADRVPLRMVAHTEIGEVSMELTDYERP